MKKIITYAHELIQEVTSDDDLVIDATCGNGYDTLFLSRLVSRGQVYAFDIQSQAIEASQALLDKHDIKNVRLLHDSHANVKAHLSDTAKISSAIFNLGYLPRGDKNIITKADSTIEAINQMTDLLLVGGRIILVIYAGHPGGEHEKNAVLNYVQSLAQDEFEVLKYQFINQKNNPPFIIAIEKRKESEKA